VVVVVVVLLLLLRLLLLSLRTKFACMRPKPACCQGMSFQQ
jgi:hypothetical protein